MAKSGAAAASLAGLPDPMTRPQVRRLVAPDVVLWLVRAARRATFNHAAEELRVVRDYEWLITNYAVIAYSALVAGSLFMAELVRQRIEGMWSEQRWLWRTWVVSLSALVLLWLAAFQAERVLWYANDLRDVARARLQEAVHRLPLVCTIHQEHWPTPPSGMPFWVRLWKSDPEAPPPCGTLARPGAGEASQATDSDFPVKPGLGLIVLLGAVFASQIIILRIEGGWEVVLLELVVLALGTVFLGEIIGWAL